MAAGALKGRGFSRAIERLTDLRHGWEAMPFQGSDAGIFLQLQISEDLCQS
jgi:hypothetical protein